jgi:hypothetical protein
MLVWPGRLKTGAEGPKEWELESARPSERECFRCPVTGLVDWRLKVKPAVSMTAKNSIGRVELR